ncbi:MAG: hypothetical protein ABIX10_15105 [Acidimicrobiales bacterium]
MGEPGVADAVLRPDQLLGLAVERAYVTFARNRLGEAMVVRRREVTSAEVAALAGPIRTVTAAAIDRWLPHAVTTWGTAEDLRALLPRIFELFTAGLLETTPEVLFAKLRHADAPGWPVAEQAALGAVTSASWRAALAQHPSPMGPAGRLLIALAELGQEISPYLDDWSLLLATRAPDAEPARRHLTDLAQRSEGLRVNGLAMGDLFWSPRPAEAARLEVWLASPLTRGHLPEPPER